MMVHLRYFIQSLKVWENCCKIRTDFSCWGLIITLERFGFISWSTTLPTKPVLAVSKYFLTSTVQAERLSPKDFFVLNIRPARSFQEVFWSLRPTQLTADIGRLGPEVVAKTGPGYVRALRLNLDVSPTFLFFELDAHGMTFMTSTILQ